MKNTCQSHNFGFGHLCLNLKNRHTAEENPALFKGVELVDEFKSDRDSDCDYDKESEELSLHQPHSSTRLGG